MVWSDRWPGAGARSLDRRHEVQIAPGDVILARLDQCEDAAELFDLCVRSGAVFCPVDPAWPPYLLHKAAGNLRPKVVVAAESELPEFGALFPDSVAFSVAEIGALVSSTQESATPDSDAPAAYLFTSGSTGTPKIVVHSRRSLEQSAALVLRTFRWVAGELLLNLPELHTMSGLRNALVAAPMGGLKWLPVPAPNRSNLFQLIDLIADSGCERIVAAPSLVRQLSLLGNRLDAGRFAGLKAIYCTGAPLSRAGTEALYRRLRVPIVNYYGLTETGGLCLSQDVDHWDPADGSLGRPVGCEARLVDEEGREGDCGELQIRSEQLMSGYLSDPAATARRFDDGWLRTGDIMQCDSDGRFHLRGRADLFIKTRSTERIHPEEIEGVLELNPIVAEAGLVGAEDENGGERLVALVVLENGQPAVAATARDLALFVRERLGQSRTPNDVRFVGKLPRLASGKLSRNCLKEMIG